MSAILSFDVRCSLVAGHALVSFFAAGRWSVELDYESATRLGRAILRASQGKGLEIELPRGWRVGTGERRITRKPQVTVHAPNGRYVAIDRAPAQALGSALISRARAADEHENALRVAEDQAMILRAGGLPGANGQRFGMGLTAHPRILDVAANLAVNDHDLRRFMPGGVLATSHYPPPRVLHTSMPAGSGALDESTVTRPPELPQ